MVFYTCDSMSSRSYLNIQQEKLIVYRFFFQIYYFTIMKVSILVKISIQKNYLYQTFSTQLEMVLQNVQQELI
jgi:hypothetical protein